MTYTSRTGVYGFRKITTEHESLITKFLEERIGTGCWGCRTDGGTLILKVLPRWVDLVCATLDRGSFLYKVVHPPRFTGVASISVLAQDSRPGSRIRGRQRVSLHA